MRDNVTGITFRGPIHTYHRRDRAQRQLEFALLSEQVNVAAVQLALDLADGDPRRLVFDRDGSVFVMNDARAGLRWVGGHH